MMPFQHRMMELSHAFQVLKGEGGPPERWEGLLGRMIFWQRVVNPKRKQDWTKPPDDLHIAALTGFRREAGVDGFNNRRIRKWARGS